MDTEERVRLLDEFDNLKEEHAYLEHQLEVIMSMLYCDDLSIHRIKKRKLAIKDRLLQLEKILFPDIIA